MAELQTKTPDYKEQIETLLSKYEEGRNIFKVATDWDYPVNIKPEFQGDPDLPRSWIALADKVISILAQGKYGLDTYPNRIDIINTGQMLDVYAGFSGVPSYNHWSFGKRLVEEEKKYAASGGGLAYEVVFNTDPVIAYCMEDNSKTMQMLVIAHASYGHNSFFKGNHMYRQFTRAGDIMEDMAALTKYIMECEEKYGEKEVELLLDACHALRLQGFDRTTKPKPRTAKERKQKEQELRQQEESLRDPMLDWTAQSKKKSFNNAANQNDEPTPEYIGEENLMRFIAEYSPVLKPWQRKIISWIADRNQYFYPQMGGQVQVMNEGWASFWHYTLMRDLKEMDLIDDGMYLEFEKSHANVVWIPDKDPRNPKAPVFKDMNPYKLGFEIFQDIKRICEEPTEEDKEYFPAIAGNGQWLETLKHAMVNFRDESFILQFLSPHLMRKMRMFAVEDNQENEDYAEVVAIHDERGYDKLKELLSAQLRFNDMVPSIKVAKYDELGDRRLTLRYDVFQGRQLDPKDTQAVAHYIEYLWGFPVEIQSWLGDRNVVQKITPHSVEAGAYLEDDSIILLDDTDLRP